MMTTKQLNTSFEQNDPVNFVDLIDEVASYACMHDSAR